MEDSSDTWSNIFEKPNSICLIQNQGQTSESRESPTSKDNTVSSVNDSSYGISQIFGRPKVCMASSTESPGQESSPITRPTSNQNADTDDTVVAKKRKFAFNRQIDSNKSNLFSKTPPSLYESVVGEPKRKKKCFKNTAQNSTFPSPQFSACDTTESSILITKKSVKLAATNSHTNSKSLSSVMSSQTFARTHNYSVNTSRTAEMSSVILKKKKSAFKELLQSCDENLFDSEPDSVSESAIQTKTKMKSFRDELPHEQSLLHELSKLSNISDNDEGLIRKRLALFGGEENVGVNFDCTISSMGDSVTEKRLDGAQKNGSQFDGDDDTLITESREQNSRSTGDGSLSKLVSIGEDSKKIPVHNEPSKLNEEINESSVDKLVLTLELELSERLKSAESFVREKVDEIVDTVPHLGDLGEVLCESISFTQTDSEALVKHLQKSILDQNKSFLEDFSLGNQLVRGTQPPEPMPTVQSVVLPKLPIDGDGDRNSQTLSSIFHRPIAFGLSQNDSDATISTSQNSSDVEEGKNRTYNVEKTLADKSSLILTEIKAAFPAPAAEDDVNVFGIDSNLLSETFTIERRGTRSSARLSTLSVDLDESVPSQLRNSRTSTARHKSNVSGRKSLRNSKRSSIIEEMAENSQSEKADELHLVTESQLADESQHKNNSSQTAEFLQPEEDSLLREKPEIEEESQSKEESEPEEESQQMDRSKSKEEEEEEEEEIEKSQQIDESEPQEESQPAEESEPEDEESQPTQDSKPREDESQSEKIPTTEQVQMSQSKNDESPPMEELLLVQSEQSSSEKNLSQSVDSSRATEEELVAKENRPVIENESVAVDASLPVDEPPFTADQVQSQNDEFQISVEGGEDPSKVQPPAVETNAEMQITAGNELFESQISEEYEENVESRRCEDDRSGQSHVSENEANENDAESAVKVEGNHLSSAFKRQDSMYLPQNWSKMASTSLQSNHKRSVSRSQAPGCIQFAAGQTSSSRSITRTTDSSVSLVHKMCDDKSSVLEAEARAGIATAVARAASKKKRKPQRFDFHSDDEPDHSVDVLPKKPNFPQFHPYCGQRFYSRIIDKMAPKYGVKTNLEAVRLAEYVWKSVKQVQNCGDADVVHEKVDQMKRTLFRKRIVVTHADFYWFCVRNLPATFNHKAVPMALVRSPVIFDLNKAFDPIADES